MKENAKAFLTPLREVVSIATELPLNLILQSKQDEPKPKGDCCIANIRTVGVVGTPRHVDVEVAAANTSLEGWTDLKRTLVQKTQLVLTLNFFGPNAEMNAQRMMRCNYIPTVSQLLYRHSIGWRSTSNPLSLSTPIEGKTENRYVIDITVMVDIYTREFDVQLTHGVQYDVLEADTDTHTNFAVTVDDRPIEAPKMD